MIVTKEKYKIQFQNGEYFDKTTNKLYLNNNETFEGEIKEGKIYSLVKGIYKWPSGQLFEGKFLKNNEYSGELKYENNYIYKGKFNNNCFEGNGEFFWGDDEYIKGEFLEGKLNGKGIMKKKNFFLKEILKIQIWKEKLKYSKLG